MMKELTTEQKAQRYDEAIERAKDALNNGTISNNTIAYLQDIFPELVESDGERIRKRIIQALHGDVLDMEETTKAIDWLEKQGKQKPADKVEPKFHEGDWVVSDDKDVHDDYRVCKITKIDDERYYIEGGGFLSESSLAVYEYRLWTIEDAKDGDVIFCKGNIKHSNGIKYERICLFNNLDNAFFTLTKTSNYVENYDIDVNIDYPDNTVPATKKQKEILFMTMKEAGYEWDADKKELKKIKPVYC